MLNKHFIQFFADHFLTDLLFFLLQLHFIIIDGVGEIADQKNYFLLTFEKYFRIPKSYHSFLHYFLSLMGFEFKTEDNSFLITHAQSFLKG
jgi:hypothetical protein